MTSISPRSPRAKFSCLEDCDSGFRTVLSEKVVGYTAGCYTGTDDKDVDFSRKFFRAEVGERSWGGLPCAGCWSGDGFTRGGVETVQDAGIGGFRGAEVF